MRSLDTIRDVRLLSGRRKISRAAVFRLPRDKSAQQSQAKTLTIVAQSPSWSSCGEQSRPTTSQSETGSIQLEQEQQYGGSQATLRPSSHSVSELSCISGEPEMEFDLYDCDIDNVMRAPGSARMRRPPPPWTWRWSSSSPGRRRRRWRWMWAAGLTEGNRYEYHSNHSTEY